VEFSIADNGLLTDQVAKKLYGPGFYVSAYFYHATSAEGNYITVWKTISADSLHIDILATLGATLQTYRFSTKFDSVRVVRADSTVYATAYSW